MTADVDKCSNSVLLLRDITAEALKLVLFCVATFFHIFFPKCKIGNYVKQSVNVCVKYSE